MSVSAIARLWDRSLQRVTGLLRRRAALLMIRDEVTRVSQCRGGLAPAVGKKRMPADVQAATPRQVPLSR